MKYLTQYFYSILKSKSAISADISGASVVKYPTHFPFIGDSTFPSLYAYRDNLHEPEKLDKSCGR